MTTYAELLDRKRVSFEPRGVDDVPALNSSLFPHQAAATEFSLRAGCSAMFLDTGLGKSRAALEWARVVVERTNKPVLMLAPLAVGPQHVREAAAIDVDAVYIREPHEITGPRTYITNYERMDKFDSSIFDGAILDESSILKSFTGATTRKLISAFARTPFRLACTATPAPNDHMELGQHAQFLGIMPSNEMLSRWFITDQTEMGRYRLKKPAVRPFWDWVASWARCASLPSDLGFSDDGFVLPPLRIERHIVAVDRSIDPGSDRHGQAFLFRSPETSATSIHKEKRRTADDRADRVAELTYAERGERRVIWVDTDYEADAITARIPEAIEVRGSMRLELKEERLDAFTRGEIPYLVTKPRIAGFGLNWQHCARPTYAGATYSYESFYQSVRRFWRFGQPREVVADVVMADTEANQWAAMNRKAGDHEAMKSEMRFAMARATRAHRIFEDYRPTARVALPSWVKEVA